MNLKDKLRLYGSKEKEQAPDRSGALKALGAQPFDSGGRSLYRFVESFAAAEVFGRWRTGGDETSLSAFARLARAGEISSMERLLFLDLETTSLSIGAGNYPFLIGMGRVSGGEAVIEQYFLDDYASEPAILSHLVPAFTGAEAIVTFNGKGFDIPLLKNRYRLNRVPRFPVDIPVVDLLYPCRRIFKSASQSCSLKAMEERVLGLPRGDDIPGWMIPDVYFSYQRYGETSRIPGVLHHNSMDIRSMMALLAVLDGIYRAVEARRFEGIERAFLTNLSRHLYHVDLDAFLDVMEFLGDEIFRDRGIFKKYGTALKRRGRLDEALGFWRRDDSLYSLEELAKHYEHREKDFAAAMDFTNRALLLIEKGIFSDRGEELGGVEREFHRERFARRLKRLKRRAEGRRI